MELRTAVHVSSSWEVCGDISTVLYLVSSSGSLLDEPLSGGRCPTPISITAPTSDPDQPCRLHIDLSDLRGYIASQIELTTSSRTTELYCDDDDEYVGTVRGTVAGTCDSNKGSLRKLYSCNHIFPTESPHQKFNLKLLSLRGMREVLVEKIQLVVAADHGGSAAVISQRPAVLGNGMDMQQLLGSLPVGGMPPFMQALVSSLTHLTTQVYTTLIKSSRISSLSLSLSLSLHTSLNSFT
ncbi:hypothetical protein GBAR_LOCUS8807 [Geodia barretti]|uniref:Uncharacterized protein n=1 Tax=Geodia barretti TaxID=519541 RepID=A0AA35RMX2_GEOBA|nr:hypothetical protein GBAR_LOCUS8807 [Geodia barretti]